MQLAPILDQYHNAFNAKYGSRLLPGHLRAIDAIGRCRTSQAGQMLVHCRNCGHAEWRPRSCGHRSCPQCQNHDSHRFGLIGNRTSFCRLITSLQPLRFPMNSGSLLGITKTSFTIFLFACASSTLKDFGLNPKYLGANIGMTAVLHTHNRAWIITRTFMSWCPAAVWIKEKNNGKRKRASTCLMNSPWPRCFVPDFWKL